MNRWALPLTALAGLLAGAGAMVAADRGPALGERAQVERVVRDYLLANPEVIPEAMGRLEKKQAARALADAGDAVTRPYAGAVMGNPDGDVTLVEFYDYNCGICRANLPVVQELVRRDPSLRVVFRELPVLAPSSRDAARASLAAAGANRFAPFHTALFAGGPVSDRSIARAAASAGVTVPARDPRAEEEIARNLETAGKLGITGVPSFVVGDQVMIGGQTVEALEKAIAAARAG